VEEIITKAAELGKIIAETDEYRTYKELSDAVNSSPERKAVLDSYTEILNKVQTTLHKGEDPGFLQSEYEENAQLVNQDEVLKAFITAQEKYLSIIQSCIEKITDL
jgi:cell fate (sporulation/competence/biofilm development) regulator YlbF (YheA/YmcA/DUF963 family)